MVAHKVAILARHVWQMYFEVDVNVPKIACNIGVWRAC